MAILRVWEYDYEVGWYEVEKQLTTFILPLYGPTRIEDLKYFE